VPFANINKLPAWREPTPTAATMPRAPKQRFRLNSKRTQLSRNDRSLRERLGCLSFLSALASICRIRSRVTENCWPTSSSVWSVFMPMPNRMRKTRSSRGVRLAKTRVVVSFRLAWIALSSGSIAFLS
jgi:hypothetical protein